MEKCKNEWLILSITCAASFVATLNWLNFTPLMVPIMADFNITHSQAGFLVTASMALPIIVQFFAGTLADKYGGGKITASILFIIFFPSLLTGFARNYVQIFIARLFIGFAAGTFPTGSRLVAEWFPKNRMGLAQGIFGAITAAGLAFSAFIMPTLSTIFNWRLAFILSSFTILPVAGVFGYLFKEPYTHPQNIKAEKTSISVLKSSQTWYISWLNFAFFGMYTGAVSWFPAYFSEEFQLSVVAAGTLVAIGLSLATIARPIGGIAGDRLRKNWLLITSTLLLAGFYFILGVRINVSTSVISVILVSWFVMFGAGALFRLPPILFPKEVGTVVGFASTLGLLLGGFILPPLQGFLIDTTHSYASVFYLLASVSLINTIAAVKIRQE